MRSRRRTRSLLVLAGFGLLPGALVAQPPTTARFVVAPYIWFTNLDGSQTVGDLDVAIGDTVLDVGAEVRLEAGLDRVRTLFTLSRATIANRTTVDDNGTPTVAVYDLTVWTAEWFASLHVGAGHNVDDAAEIYVGARYVTHGEELAVGGTARDTRESWIEPLIGARYFRALGRYLWATVQSDLGGFGAGSDFTWKLQSEVGLHLVSAIDLTIVYRYIETDYAKGADGYRWHGATQGWLMGATISR